MCCKYVRKIVIKRFSDQLFSVKILLIIMQSMQGDGAVVRALASHQCGPVSIPGLGVICGLSLLVLVLAPRVFLRVLGFPPSSKTNISKLQKKNLLIVGICNKTFYFFLFYLCFNSCSVEF